MTNDKSVGGQMYDAMNAGDIRAFEQLLKEHPDELRTEDGNDYWLNATAGKGLLPFVQLLVQKGIGVNESVSEDYPHNTAIVSAAGKGHFDVVRWLLDHGATINWTINGETKCPALLVAAEDGHLQVVKLLVERGADANAHQSGINPLDWAIRFGHQEVVDYLRSVGAKTVFEMVPEDLPARLEAIKRLMARTHAPLSSFQLPDPGDPPFTIYATEPGKKRGISTVFTAGMNVRGLKLPDGSGIVTELRVRLPKGWPAPEKAMKNDRWNWPFLWLRKIAREALSSGQWPDRSAALFMNGNPPRPLASNTRLAGWVVLHGDSGNHQMPDYRWIDMRTLVAIYPEEHELILKDGYTTFVRRLHESDVPDYLILDRPNLAK